MVTTGPKQEFAPGDDGSHWKLLLSSVWPQARFVFTTPVHRGSTPLGRMHVYVAGGLVLTPPMQLFSDEQSGTGCVSATPLQS
jgi:hypothetical protein